MGIVDVRETYRERLYQKIALAEILYQFDDLDLSFENVGNFRCTHCGEGIKGEGYRLSFAELTEDNVLVKDHHAFHENCYDEVAER